MSKQKEQNRNRKQQSQNSIRSSDEFVYNPDIQRHIGKRTGNFYRRVNPKQNFDGFPRFSQYQSHRNTMSSSLARQLQTRNSISVVLPNKSRQSQKQGEPFETKESPIVVPSDNTNNSSRMPESGLPGFGQHQISSIKRRTSVIRPSELKSYKDLLNQLETDQFKQFIFNEEQIKERNSSPKKQKEKQMNVDVNILRKPKKQMRVSFNQRELKKEFCYSFKKSQTKDKQQQNINHKQKQSSESLSFKLQEDKINLCKQQNQFNTIASCPDYFTDVKQLNPSFAQQVNQQQKKKEKKNNRKKKQLRITDQPEDTPQIEQQKLNKNKGTKTKSKDEKQLQLLKQKEKIKQKMTRKSRLKVEEEIKKTAVNNKSTTSQAKSQYLQKLVGDQNQEQNNRYPKRTRIRPVKYWDNQKVHYKAGKAIGIQNAHLNFKDLINANQQFQSHINVNFHTHDIEIEVVLPAKKQLISNGIKDRYKVLQLQLKKQEYTNKKQEDYKIYFDNNIKSQRILPNSISLIESCTYFQVVNRGNFPAVLLMRLKVKKNSDKKE